MKRNCPPYVAENFKFTRSLRNPQILFPHILFSIYEKSFQIRVSRVWNTLPKELKIFSYTDQIFKKRLKNYLKEQNP